MPTTPSQRSKTAPVSYDPYDLWMTGAGVRARDAFYRGNLIGKLACVLIAVADWLFPTLSRKLLRSKERAYPITVAQWILSDHAEDPALALDQLLDTSVPNKAEYGCAWGLGFPWMSKNGLYDETLPFITHTPYAMEALLQLSQHEITAAKAMAAFHDTWSLLEALHVMHDQDDQLALSYAPVEEPRIVVNANAYAAHAYSLHGKYGKDENRAIAREKAKRLANWVVSQQEDNGSWYYYADEEAGNFIDGFHSCFVLKNLIKAGEQQAEIKDLCQSVIESGCRYLESEFLCPEKKLLKRFSVRDIKDPFVWDIYDQAEYIGLLALLGRAEEASSLYKTTYETFYKNGHWYARQDFFGRLWGKDFLRWGIYPLFHSLHSLQADNGN